MDKTRNRTATNSLIKTLIIVSIISCILFNNVAAYHVINNVNELAFDGFGNVVNGVSTAGNAVGGFVSDQGKHVVNGVSTAGNAVGGFVSNQGKHVVNGVSTAANAVGGFVSDQGKNVVNGVSNTAKKVGNALKFWELF